jgi:hypothetical protein
MAGIITAGAILIMVGVITAGVIRAIEVVTEVVFMGILMMREIADWP